MKIKQFDAIELKDNSKATILQVCKNKYYAQITNKYGETIENRYINKSDMNCFLYKKER